MTINLTQLIADREAGTDGKWSERIGDECMVIPVSAKVFRINNNAEIDARRIARVPELEAAFLEAVELLGKVGKADPWSRDVIDFLERFK